MLKKIVIQRFVLLFLIVVLMLIDCKLLLAQSGNQSDITGPDVQEIINNNEQSDGDDIPSSPVDRAQFEKQFISANTEQAIDQFESMQALEFGQYLGLTFYGKTASSADISKTLTNLSEKTGEKAALVYVASLEDQLQSIMIPPNVNDGGNKSLNKDAIAQNSDQIVRQVVPQGSRQNLREIVNDFRAKITNPRGSKSYLIPAKKLYDLLIAPIEPSLKANNIKTIIFSLDGGLRTLPIAALHDGKQFLIEKYGVAIIPSFSLTDSRYVPISKTQMLAVGISKSVGGQNPLPLAELEVETLINKLWTGKQILNEKSTFGNFKVANYQQKFGIIHLATHGEFRPGKINNSYIQFWDTKFRLDQMAKLSSELKWNNRPTVEMLVLSACRTALGNQQTELGFAGLAVQAGVKTALGSLWYVSDEGAMALMTKFYEQLRVTGFRAEALRKAQIALLKGQVRFEKGKLRISERLNIPLPSNANSATNNIDLSHPYFWSGFIIIGNWN